MQEEAKTIAVTRTLGIIAGVSMTLLLSVSILPVSAHHQHEEALNKALHSLLSLQALCWVPLTHTHEAHGPSFLSPTPTAHPPPGGCQTRPEHSPHTSARTDSSLENEMICVDSCTAPLLPSTSPHASPTRSWQVPPSQENLREEAGIQGVPMGSSFITGGPAWGFGSGGTIGGSSIATQLPEQRTLVHSQLAPASSVQNLSTSQQGSKLWPHEAQPGSSSGCCGASSGRGSNTGLVKRSDFFSVNWEMHNLQLNEDGDIRSAEDIVVEVLPQELLFRHLQTR